jgi:hypothetical protein
MPKRGNHIWPNFKLPADLAENEEFLINLKGEVVSQASSDAPSGGDLAAIIGKYNAASENEREAMNDVLVWMTGYSLPSLAVRAFLSLSSSWLAPTGDEEFHDLMTQWADAAKWKGSV